MLRVQLFAYHDTPVVNLTEHIKEWLENNPQIKIHWIHCPGACLEIGFETLQHPLKMRYAVKAFDWMGGADKTRYQDRVDSWLANFPTPHRSFVQNIMYNTVYILEL